jgi:methionine-rich copper-binding protein CopC
VYNIASISLFILLSAQLPRTLNLMFENNKKNEHKTIIILDTKNKQINTNKNTKHAQNEIKFRQK